MEAILIATDDITALLGNSLTCATQLNQFETSKEKITEILTTIEYQYIEGIYHYTSTKTIYVTHMKIQEFQVNLGDVVFFKN